MAYSRWRKDNITALQRQQILEAVSGFRCYVAKHNLDCSFSPTIGKKCLQNLNRLRTTRQQNESVTISEVLQLQQDLSDIVISDLLDESSLPKDSREKSLEMPTLSSREQTSMSDSSDDENEALKAFMNSFTSNDASKDSQTNAMKSLGALTGSLMNTMMNPLLDTSYKILEGVAPKIIVKLDEKRKDLKNSADDRKFYAHSLEYYTKLLNILKSNMNNMQRAAEIDRLNKKYDSERIALLLKKDPDLAELVNNTNTNVDLGNLESAFEGLNNLDSKDCVIS